MAGTEERTEERTAYIVPIRGEYMTALQFLYPIEQCLTTTVNISDRFVAERTSATINKGGLCKRKLQR